MEDMWNLKACMNNRSSGQPSPGSSSLNQFDMNPGHLSQPYVAQEVCVIERTIRQEPVGLDMLNFGPQGLTPNKWRSELLAMVQQQQQQQHHRPNYAPSISARSTYIASHPQFRHISSDSPGFGGWNSLGPANVFPSNHVNGGGSSNSGLDAPQSGHGRDLSGLAGGRMQDTISSNGLRTSGSETLKQSLNFSRGAQEQGLEASRQAPSPQWLKEIVSLKQRIPSVQGPNLFSSNSDQQRNESIVPDVGSGVPSQSQSAPPPSGRIRVFCPNYGISIGGELSLTDAGRLGVICTCHGMHMSVAKFTQHAGVGGVNPGDAVFMEGGETLVQWRKMFFGQYRVKVPDDNVGWDWLDDPVEPGQGKYKAVMTQSWQKEVDVSYGNNTPIVKSRTTQVWDASLENGHNPMLHATQSISNTRFAPLNTGQSMQESRDALLKSFGRTNRGGTVPSYLGTSQFYSDTTHTDIGRSQGGTGCSTSLHRADHLVDMPMSNEYNFINDSHRYLSPAQQVSAALRNVTGLGYTSNRWSDGQDLRTKENDSSSSNFELRLGQPSQQTPPAGASFSSIPTRTTEQPKSRLCEQIMSRVAWDGRFQHDVQQFNPAELPRFSGNPGQTREQASSTTSHQQVGYNETARMNNQRAEDRSYLNPASMQTSRCIVNLPQPPNAVPDNLQTKLLALDCGPNSQKVSRSGDGRVQNDQSGLDKSGPKFVPHTEHLRRSAMLETGSTLDPLSSGALGHLSNKMGQRLQDMAIQTSYAYRGMGLDGSATQSHDGVNKRVGESLPGGIGDYERPPFIQQMPFLNFAVRNDVQHDHTGTSHGTNSARFQQGPNSIVNMQDHGSSLQNHLAMHRYPVEQGSSMHDEVGAKGTQPPSEEFQHTSKEFQDWSQKPNGNCVDVQDQQRVLNDKQTWSQSAPDGDNVLHSGLGYGEKTPHLQNNGLDEGQGGSKSGHDEAHCQPLSEPETRNTRPVEEDTLGQDDLVTQTDDREDRHCTCYNCRKESPSTRGRAVPRLVGQVCLKEKGGSGTKTVPAKNKPVMETSQRLSKTHQSPQIHHKSTDLISDVIPVKHGKIVKYVKDSSSQQLSWEDVQELSEDHSQQLETAARSEPLADTAANDVPLVADNLHVPKTLSDVCSKSSENVLSGLSDEGCDNDEGIALPAQSQGKIPAAGVLDECSGIGKCSSSDDVDMGAAPNPSPVVPLEDTGRQSPSCNNSMKRLVVKRVGSKAAAGWQMTQEAEQSDQECEPVLSAGKSEKKRRRTMKWKRLGPDVVVGEGKKGKSVTIPEQVSGPKIPVEKPETGTAMKKSESRVDQGARDWGQLPKASVEKEPLLKRRRVALAINNPSSVAGDKQTEVIQEKLGAPEVTASQRKVGTLVIRVPQGVNRQKAKRAVRTNSHFMKPPTVSKADVVDEGRPLPGRITEGAVATILNTSKGNLSNKNSGHLATGATVGPSQPTPSLLPKNLRTVRTPLGAPSPRNGRMVSLSVILNQSTEPQISIKVNEAPKEKNPNVDKTKIKVDMPKSKPGISRSNHDGNSQKKSAASAGCVAIKSGLSKEVHVSVVPELESSCKEGKLMRVLHKEDTRKVRSLWELTGKDKTPVSVAEVFEFAEEDADIAMYGKQGAKIVLTEQSTPRTNPLSGISYPFPRSGRSARSFQTNKRIAELNRSKHKEPDPGKTGSQGLEEERTEVQTDWGVHRDSTQTSAAHVWTPKLDLYQNCNSALSPVTKQIRSSKWKNGKVVLNGVRVKHDSPNGKSQMRDKSAHMNVAQDKTPEARISKRESNHLDMNKHSAKRQKLLGEVQKKEVKSEGSSGKPLESCEEQRPLEKEVSLKKTIHDHVGGDIKIRKQKVSLVSREDGKSFPNKTKKPFGGSEINVSQPERSKCDVCAAPGSVSYNKLLLCGRCPVKVHQACYGVSKLPKGPWFCRTCKFNIIKPVCVLCGYGGGAMTRVQKSRGFCQTLLNVWQALHKEKKEVPSDLQSDEDDDETLLSATISMQSTKNNLSAGLANKTLKNNIASGNKLEQCSCGKPAKYGSSCKTCIRENSRIGSTGIGNAEHPSSASEDWHSNNTITAFVKDAGAKQWAHMVCTLWMPGTRCLNMETMGVFDVSGVASFRRKSICSICERKGGACIQCRVPKCSTPFHVWCAHEKGLLQSEIVQDGTNQVGFFGKCLRHRNWVGSELDDDAEMSGAAMTDDMAELSSSREACARTEGYKGRQTLQQRAFSRQKMTLEGCTAVTAEQVAEWLRINDRKSSSRRFIKPANSVMKYDHREYLRFKQKKGWKRLAVCKSGIHALGLYTTEFIAEGEVVVEYVGEIVGLRVADKREAEYHSGKRLQYQGACYLFRIDTEQIIDATRKGGIARFVNHSCSPNCVAKVICVDNLKKVIFFAKRDIQRGEEVTYDYKFNYDEVGDKIPCFCGSPDCRGTLN